ncbi:MAG: hypothetical protein ACYSSO_04300 [Planctomycetota bacterium]
MSLRTNLKAWVISSVLLLLVVCATGTGDVIYVDTDATGADDGTNWTNAYNYLQDGLADANSGDEIKVAWGTYKPDANSDNPSGSGYRTATFQLISGVAIYGGYAGYGEPDPNARDIEIYETILSGDLVVGNSYHVVTSSGTDANAILDSFTIAGGDANGSDSNSVGGGMYNYQGSPTVSNCTFRGNKALGSGGMFNWYESSPSVSNCIFIGNSAEYSAGGMTNGLSSNLTVTGCTFKGNTAGTYGGGMNNVAGSDPMIAKCTFITNSAGTYGGGMHNDGSYPTVKNCTFNNNSTGSLGGGICNVSKANPTVTNCTLAGNWSDANGGGVCNFASSSSTLTNCILWGNTASNGPQIHNEASSGVTVSYCDVQGGWAGTGNIDEDPQFVDANGLDGIPGTADDEDYSVHLLPAGSPCFNAGDPNGDYSGQGDIDGQPRVAYGRVDIGADEVFPILGDFEPDGGVDFADFAKFADNWLMGP